MSAGWFGPLRDGLGRLQAGRAVLRKGVTVMVGLKRHTARLIEHQSGLKIDETGDVVIPAKSK